MHDEARAGRMVGFHKHIRRSIAARKKLMPRRFFTWMQRILRHISASLGRFGIVHYDFVYRFRAFRRTPIGLGEPVQASICTYGPESSGAETICIQEVLIRCVCIPRKRSFSQWSATEGQLFDSQDLALNVRPQEASIRRA